ncbi:MAG: DEAD/DEAH box helicase [Myxococcales bacterium]|nr:DEAD/DEAH box helicase [Myxococcales bacterium]
MALRGVFVGVGRHRDPNIRDLMCARADAVAFSTLFQDALPDLDAETLTDDEATLVRVREALERHLLRATAEDTVLVTFSGHGSRDHRLAVHDTELARLAASTIGMAELADLFKKSPARAIVLVLDCCFAGAAPARVLDDSPAPRDIAPPLAEIAGRGRILLAAAGLDQQAWEQPGTGHGLLTKAVLDVLRGASAPVDILAAGGRVMEIVRVEAARLGQVQTPVVFGSIEGGLTMPALHAGPRFLAAFPDRGEARVSSDVGDLAQLGIPAAIVAAWRTRFPAGLNPLQQRAVNEGRVLAGESLLVVAPTSAGKTFVGEMAAIRAVTEGRKAVFLLPYRALVNEKYEDFVDLYGHSLGLRVVRCTGDYQDQTAAFVFGKYDLAVLTYEMFLNLAVGRPAVLDALGLVVVDEAQFLTDPRRGIAVELLLTLVLAARGRGVAPQILALSAVIGAVNDFDGWLRAGRLVTTERPVPLIEGVLDRSGLFRYVDPSGTRQTEQLLPSRAIRMRTDKPSAQDVLVPLVQKLVHDGDETVLVFRNRRGPAEGCANYLAAELGLPPAERALAALPQHDPSSTSAQLRRCLERGTAFHDANLTREERLAVERAFRGSEVRVIAATSTLAAGINTPASTVILAEQQFLGEDGRAFTVAEYKNMAGRAGRPGFSLPGRAIILADTSYAAEALLERYVRGTPEPMTSSFDPASLETWVLRLLAQVKQVPVADVLRLLTNTFGGYIATRRDTTWQDRMVDRMVALLDEMGRLKLVEYEGNDVQLSLLGRACGRSSLSFRSCMRLVGLLQGVVPTTLTAERLMVLVQVLDESDGGYTPLMPKAHKEKARPRELALRTDIALVSALQHLADNDDYIARCKRALVLLDWIEGVAVETLEERYSPTPYQGKIGLGDVRRFADATRFHLRAAHQIAQVMFIDTGPSEESVESLLKRLELGLPHAALALLAIPASWSRGECLALLRSGVASPEALFALNAEALAGIVGAERGKAIAALRPRSAA